MTGWRLQFAGIVGGAFACFVCGTRAQEGPVMTHINTNIILRHRNGPPPGVTPTTPGATPRHHLAGTIVGFFTPRHYSRIPAQAVCIIAMVLIQMPAWQASALATDFSGANLRGAQLTNADLRGANLKGAILTDANLSRTDLTGATITQQQLDTACGSGTTLPAGLRIKPCPHPTVSETDRSRHGQRLTAIPAQATQPDATGPSHPPGHDTPRPNLALGTPRETARP
jgi:hypothetical protein